MMSPAEELYAAARALDEKAKVNNPAHAYSDFTVTYAEMGPLMRALRRYERAAEDQPQ